MGTAVAVPKDQIRDFEGQLVAQKQTFEALAPAGKGFAFTRFAKVAVLAVSRDPGLMAADRPSLWRALTFAAEVGLEPNGQFGGVHLVRFYSSKVGKDIVTPIVDYRGLIRLASRGGVVSHVEAGVIHKNDRLRYVRGFKQEFEHEPNLGDPGEPVAAYAIAWINRNNDEPFPKLCVLPWADIMALKAKVEAKNRGRSGPWATDTEAMGTKTAIRRVLKDVAIDPTSDLARSLEQEEEVDQMVISTTPVPDVADTTEAQPPAGKADALARKIRKKKDTEETPTTPANPNLKPIRSDKATAESLKRLAEVAGQAGVNEESVFSFARQYYVAPEVAEAKAMGDLPDDVVVGLIEDILSGDLS